MPVRLRPTPLTLGPNVLVGTATAPYPSPTQSGIIPSMPRSKYRFYETEYPYFMTCTVVGWLPVFTRPETVNIIFDSWRYLARHDSFSLHGYVVLENHLHFIASAPNIGDTVKRFKSFTAKQILGLLESQRVETLLEQFRFQKRAHKTGSDYQFWEEGSHPQQIGSEEMMRQKLEYIHNNPVKRGYVDDPCHWRYSSARNYEGQTAIMEVATDWR
jgi:putative transposase